MICLTQMVIAIAVMVVSVVLITPLAAAGSGRADIVASDQNIQYSGRWDRRDVSKAICGWGATYINIIFGGTSCVLKLKDGKNNFCFSVDGGTFQTLVTDEREEYVLATGLPKGEHSLLLIRRTEGSFGLSEFKGFTLDPGCKLLPPSARPERRLEFIGDSITAGYGNEGKTQNRHTQNGYLAYGPQTARLLDAEFHVIARSGIGIYKSLSDKLPPSQPVMSDYFSRTYFSWHPPSMPAWDFSSWQPHGVVLALGSNDFIGVTPDEGGFKTAYNNFLDFIRVKYPKAHIFCFAPFIYKWNEETSHDLCRAYIREVIIARGDARVYFVDPTNGNNIGEGHWLVGPSDYIGDWTHPTVGGNSKIAKKLAPIIKGKLGW